MITREALNVAVGSFIDSALTAAGIPAERRKSDDTAPIARRSVQIQLEELTIEPMGVMRRCTQTVVIYFYPENETQYRDEIWTAVNALETALINPIVVDGAELYADDDDIVADMSGEVLEITVNLTWIEVRDLDSSIETIEEIDLELSPEAEACKALKLKELHYGVITRD